MNRIKPKPQQKSIIVISAVVSVICISILAVLSLFFFTDIFAKEKSEIEPVNNFPQYQEIKKSLFISRENYNPKARNIDQYDLIKNHNFAFDRLVEFSLFHGFTEITLFSGSVEWEASDFDRGQLPHQDYLLQALRKLRSKNIQVNLAFYLNDEINNMTSWQYSSTIANIVKGLNSSDTPIKMIHFDQEPDQLSAYPSLISMLKQSNDIFPTGTSVKPLWLKTGVSGIQFSTEIAQIITQNKQISSLADLINYFTTNAQIMAYSNKWNAVESLANEMKASAAKFGKISTPIIETSFGGNMNPEETLTAEIQKDQDAWYKNVVEFAGKHENIVIHDYRHYYANYFCTQPVIWKGVSEKRNCNAEIISDSQAPDIEYDYTIPGGGDDIIPGPDPELLQNFQAYKQTSKGLYVWDHSKPRIDGKPAWELLIKNHNFAFDRLVEFSLFHGFTEITLFSGSVEWEASDFDRGQLPHQDYLLQALRKLRSKNIQVNLAFYLNDEINNMTSWQYSSTIANIVKGLNSSDTPIKMIHFDQEPDQLSAYPSLISMLKQSNDIFPTGTSVKPLWLKTGVSGIQFSTEIAQIITQNKQISSLADLINYFTTNAQIMAYSNKWNAVESLANEMKASAAKFGKISTPIIETSFGGNMNPEETLTAEIQKDQDAWYKNVVEFAGKHENIVIHDYRHYYANYFCTQPVIWKGVSEKRNCNAEIISDSQAPDIEYDYTIPGGGDDIIPGPDPELLQNFQAYKQTSKGLYVWDHSKPRIDGKPAWELLIKNHNFAFDRLVEFSLFHGFTEITLFSGSVEWEASDFDRGQLPHQDYLLQALRKLRSKNIQVNLAFYLNDEINNMTSWQYSSTIANIVKGLNSSDTPIKMIHFDQEPDQLSAYPSLISMLKQSNDIFPTGTSVKPLWLKTGVSGIQFSTEIAQIITQNKQISSLADLINYFTTNAQIMAYSNKWNAVESLANEMKASAAKFGKISTPIIETSFGGNMNPEETLTAEIQKDQDAWYKNVVEFAGKHENIVIHDYRHYYANYFCTQPVIWKGVSEKRNCNAEIISDSQAPDIEYDYTIPGGGDDIIPGPDPELLQNFQAYKQTSKGLYVWDHSKPRIDGKPAWELLIKNHNFAFDRLVEFSLFHGFTEITLFSGSVEWEASDFDRGQLPHQDYLLQALRKLRSKNIQVNLAFYLNDEINNMTSGQYSSTIANIVKGLNSSDTPIKMIHFDQEPDQLSAYPSLISMLKQSNDIFPTGTSVKPLWLKTGVSGIQFSTEIAQIITQNKQISSLADLINYFTTNAQIMAYSNKWNAVESLANEMKASAAKFGKISTPIIETSFGGNMNPEETLTAEIQKDQDAWYKNVVEFAGKHENIVIHDYRHYYANYFCTQPVIWKGVSEKRNCNAEIISDSQAPDIEYDYTIPGGGDDIIPGPDPELLQNFQAYKQTSKGLYVWDHSKPRIDGKPAWELLIKNHNFAFDRLVEFSLFHGFTEITLFSGSVEWEASDFDRGQLPHQDYLLQALRKLRSKNIQVNLAFYLNDEINNMTSWQYSSTIANIVKGLNSSDTPIKMIHFDQEPDQLSAYPSLISMLKQSNDIFPTGTSVKPLWLKTGVSGIQFSTEIAQIITQNKQISSLADLINYFTTNAQIMAYSNKWNAVESLANEMKASAAKFGKISTPIIETSFGGNMNPEETLTAEIQKDQDAWYKNVVEFAGKHENIVIHDYRHYYANYFCTQPVIWKGVSEKRNCNAEIISDSQAPDIEYDYN